MRAKQNEHDFILSRLRVENAGPIGPQGLMGRDGAEGRPGVRGEKGERGERGLPAPRVTGWAVDTDNFTAVPILSDGSNAATLRLRPLFESFNDQINASDEEADAAAARAMRARNDDEVEERRWATR
jgi:hypothetical protein